MHQNIKEIGNYGFQQGLYNVGNINGTFEIILGSLPK